jgi:plasmid stabilization system protein ParE
MDCKIVRTEPALEDLKEVVRFLADDDPEAALGVGKDILAHVEILKTFPEIVPVYRHRRSGDVRQVTRRPFRVFYRFQAATKRVEIPHVWHGARQDPADLAGHSW